MGIVTINMLDPILSGVTIPPKAGKSKLHIWSDYIEIRCITDIDKKFSIDALSEAIYESKDVQVATFDDDDDDDQPEVDESSGEELTVDERTNKLKAFSVDCFKNIKWRRGLFSEQWPFILNEDEDEISLRKNLTLEQTFYIQLLLSSVLKYCPKKRRKCLTSKFEKLSFEIFKKLMPEGAEIHQFGAAESKKYSGHLFDRLTALTGDIRGEISFKKSDFSKRDSGDGGLDLVSWHPMGDTRKGLPIAFAQCGCTAEEWSNKALEASPASLGVGIHVVHDWAAYYFMPLDLSASISSKLNWWHFSDLKKSIFVDRLRLLNLAKQYSLYDKGIFDAVIIAEATSLSIR